MNSVTKQSDDSFEDINQLVWGHLLERDWHNQPVRNYATSIAVEAGELLEHFQWSDKPIGNKDALANELADVLIYCFEFAQATGIDMSAAIKKKLTEAAKKYPAENFKGKQHADMHVAWLEAHNAHRAKKKGL